MNALIYYGCCCCCCWNNNADTAIQRNLTAYEEITIGSEEEEEDEEGVDRCRLDLLGSTSSDTESAEEFPVECFMSDENSVDDSEYYHLYRPNGHTQRKKPPHSKSAKKAAACITEARTQANDCLNSTTRLEYEQIRDKYEEALERCPFKYKASLVREYEAFKHVFSLFSEKTDDYKQAERFARAQWQQAVLLDHTVSRRQHFYRRALTSMPDYETKAAWKKEYNAFYKQKCLS